MTDRMAQEETLLKFPCKFPIKVICEQDPTMLETIRSLLFQFVKDSSSIHIQTRESTQQNYLSVTATFIATSKWELDQLYQALSSHPKVKMVL